MKRAALASVLLLLAAAGCGSSRRQAEPSTLMTSEAAPTTAATTTASAPPATTALAVYFVRDGKLAPVRRTVPATKAVGAAALTQLLAGPTAAERAAGLSSAIPSGTSLSGLSIDAGNASLDGVDGLDSEATGQIVYTLTQFPTVHSVNELTRHDVEDVAPAIVVESPLPGDTVTSPVHVRGTASVFEAAFDVVLEDAQGQIAVAHVTASAGAPERGSFEATLTYPPSRAGPARLVAFDLSQESGVREHVVTIPLVLR